MYKNILLLVLTLLSMAGQAESFPRLDLAAGIHRIDAEVAYTQDTRMQGLMNRPKLGEQQGMLFVFPDKARHCMWMRNTLVALSVAFLDDAGRIINVEDMAPQTENNHCAAKPARFALEMNLGWFKRKGVVDGAPIVGVDRAPYPQ